MEWLIPSAIFVIIAVGLVLHTRHDLKKRREQKICRDLRNKDAFERFKKEN